MNLSTMSPTVFPPALYTVVSNDVSKFSMINASGGFSFPTFSLLLPGITQFGDKLTPVPATTVLSWYFTMFCSTGGP